MSVYALFISNHPQVSFCLHVSAMRSLSPHLICARQENKQMIMGKENQPTLKLYSLFFFEWKREFCRAFYPWLQYFGQLLSDFNMVYNSYTGNLILWWLHHHLVTPVLTRPLLSKRKSKIAFCVRLTEWGCMLCAAGTGLVFKILELSSWHWHTVYDGKWEF